MSLKLVSPQALSSSKDRFFILLCLVMGLLVLAPILNRFIAARIFLDTFITAIAVSMVYTISYKKYHAIVEVVLAVVMLSTIWLQYLYQDKTVAAIGTIAGIFFVLIIIVNILMFMINSEVVTSEVIYAALLSYLLAALMWAFLYTFLELVDPTSFNIDLDKPTSYFLVFQYYSIVTITTLGYGDITPVTDVAKAFSALEALAGQLYLVVVVAWLVGMHVSRKAK